MVWESGKSGNPNGRPKGSKNKSNPFHKLQKALENSHDLVELKKLGLKMLANEDNTFSAAQLKDIYKTLVELDVELLKLDFKHTDNEDDGEQEKKEVQSPLNLKMVKK